MSSARGSILVVDDDPNIRQIVRRYLVAEQFMVTEAIDGSDALAKGPEGFDLVVLDVSMPGIDGYEVLRRIRATSMVPVILLTARSEEVDLVVGLSLGADDYITKPFSPRELIARTNSVLRRSRSVNGLTGSATDVLVRGELVIDVQRREVTRSGTTVEVTTREFDLLVALASAPGRVFSRRQLLEQVWGYDYYGDDRVIDVHIRNLRKALHDEADDPTFIATVRGVGYKFVGTDR